MTTRNRTGIVLALAAVAMVALVFTATSANAALISYWSFDTDASDGMGAHNGTLVNGAAISAGNLGFGGGEALSLGGGSGLTADHVTTANPTTFDFNTDFTWHAYVKTSSGSGAIFGRSPATPIIHNQGSKILFISSNTPRFDTGWVGAVNTGVAVNDNQWHQVIATYVAATDQLDIFVDPVAGATTGNYSGTHDVNRFDEHTLVHNGGLADTSFRIGQGSDNFNSNAITGLIDEAAVFNTALAGADLDQLITSGPVSFVPEPATMSLLALGGLALLRRRRS